MKDLFKDSSDVHTFRCASVGSKKDAKTVRYIPNVTRTHLHQHNLKANLKNPETNHPILTTKCGRSTLHSWAIVRRMDPTLSKHHRTRFALHRKALNCGAHVYLEYREHTVELYGSPIAVYDMPISLLDPYSITLENCINHYKYHRTNPYESIVSLVLSKLYEKMGLCTDKSACGIIVNKEALEYNKQLFKSQNSTLDGTYGTVPVFQIVTPTVRLLADQVDILGGWSLSQNLPGFPVVCQVSDVEFTRYAHLDESHARLTQALHTPKHLRTPQQKKEIEEHAKR